MIHYDEWKCQRCGNPARVGRKFCSLECQYALVKSGHFYELKMYYIRRLLGIGALTLDDDGRFYRWNRRHSNYVNLRLKYGDDVSEKNTVLAEKSG